MSDLFDAGCNGDCGSCGSDCDGDLASKATVTLTLENDEVIECQIICSFAVGEKEYIALLPLDENGENEDGEVYLYRYAVVNGSQTLENIMDDEEYEAAAEGFDEYLDSLEFDELEQEQLEGIVGHEAN